MNTDVYWQESKRQWNVPNALTYSRALVGVALPLFWIGGPEWLAIAIVYAGISDGLDGWLARRLKAETPIGRVIDPLADKVFTDFFLLGLAFTEASLLFAVLAVVTILYDVDNIYQRRHDIARAFKGQVGGVTKSVTWLSKTKTVVLFVFMIVSLRLEWLPVFDPDKFALFTLIMVGLSWIQSRRVTLRKLFLRWL